METLKYLALNERAGGQEISIHVTGGGVAETFHPYATVGRIAYQLRAMADRLERMAEARAKFAALIAEECAKEVDRHQDLVGTEYQNPEIAANAAADAIRNAFPMPKGEA